MNHYAPAPHGPPSHSPNPAHSPPSPVFPQPDPDLHPLQPTGPLLCGQQIQHGIRKQNLVKSSAADINTSNQHNTRHYPNPPQPPSHPAAPPRCTIRPHARPASPRQITHPHREHPSCGGNQRTPCPLIPPQVGLDALLIMRQKMASRTGITPMPAIIFNYTHIIQLLVVVLGLHLRAGR